MKKTLIATLLAAAALAASAGTTGFVSYDHSVGTAPGAYKVQELDVGLAVDTAFGTIDGAMTANRYRFAAEDNTGGFELGYSRGVVLGTGLLTGRVGYGEKHKVNPDAGAYAGNLRYYSLIAEYAAPVAGKVGWYVNFRQRGAMNHNIDTPHENSIGGGVDYSLTKRLTLRAGYIFSAVSDVNYNGALLTASYAF